MSYDGIDLGGCAKCERLEAGAGGTCDDCVQALRSKLESMTQARDSLYVVKEVYSKEAFDLQAKLRDVNFQLSEVTAHRDRLRDMLNDVRGMIFTARTVHEISELAARIIRRIDPVEDDAAEKPKGAPTPLCDAQVGCFGQCGKLLPCEDHPPKLPGICDLCTGSMKLPSGADCPMCTEPNQGH